jgi:electron transfer flavoprotein alpha subunit
VRLKAARRATDGEESPVEERSTATTVGVGDSIRPDRPLKIAALIKQVPLAESFRLGADGRLDRSMSELEMNPYCRRAVSKAVELARSSGGEAIAFTLGPPAAEDVLREAVAWGADAGIHLCDPLFAGSDTLATAKALQAGLSLIGPFDLVLVGRNTTDGDTGQVGPEVAQLLDLPFVTGVRHLDLEGDRLVVEAELDDGRQTVALSLPAVLSVAERLIEPAKVPPEGRAAVPGDRLRLLRAGELGQGPWGDDASPTKVGGVRPLGQQRSCHLMTGSLEEQVHEALLLLVARGAFESDRGSEMERERALADVAARTLDPAARRIEAPVVASATDEGHRPLCVLAEPGRPGVVAEFLSAIRALRPAGARVVVFGEDGAFDPSQVATPVEEFVVLEGDLVAEDVAFALSGWASREQPFLILAPATAYGREVAGRVAADHGAGLVGDAIALEEVDGRLVAPKSALSGALVADIWCTSRIQLVTVRPGVLPPPVGLGSTDTLPLPPHVHRHRIAPRRRLVVLGSSRDDDVELLARASVVIGVGTGVAPEDYPLLQPLQRLLDAELAATRKVTDRSWMPRARQVGITGRSISPRLYLAVGVAGKFNHVVGVRNAGTIVAINSDPSAPIFSFSDVGVVGDWKQAVELLARQLPSVLEEQSAFHERAV